MGRLLLAVPPAVAAAALFAVATALQRRAAIRTPTLGGIGPRRLGRFALATLRQPLWLLAMVAELVGLACHVLALHLGTLVLVQPLMICGVLFAIPIDRWADRQRITARELRWGGALIVGLVVFLVVATPHGPQRSQPPDALPALLAGAAAVVAIAGCVTVARRRPPNQAAALLGGATGIAWAVVAALIKGCTELAVHHGVGALVANWQLWALVVAGAVGLLGNQVAFQAGPLTASLPAMTTVDPVLSVLLGVGVYDERLRHSAAALTVETAAFLLLLVAAVALARDAGARLDEAATRQVAPPAP